MSLRARVQELVESPTFQRVVIGVIMVNAVTLGLETSDAMMARAGGVLARIDQVILAVYVGELGLRLYAHRLRFSATRGASSTCSSSASRSSPPPAGSPCCARCASCGRCGWSPRCRA